MTILIVLDGVIRENDTPVREGRLLYDALINAGERVVFLSDDTEERTEHWLVQYSFHGYSGILTPKIRLTEDDNVRERQIRVSRALGRVDLVIDVDPATIKFCLDLQQPAMLFTHPRTTRPTFRPEGALQTWAELEKQMEQQKIKKAKSLEDDGDDDPF